MHADMLFIALVVLNIADANVTIRRIREGASEANFVLARLIERLGLVPGVLIPKTAFLVATYLTLPSFPWWLLASLVAWYAYWAAREFRV